MNHKSNWDLIFFPLSVGTYQKYLTLSPPLTLSFSILSAGRHLTHVKEPQPTNIWYRKPKPYLNSKFKSFLFSNLCAQRNWKIPANHSRGPQQASKIIPSWNIIYFTTKSRSYARLISFLVCNLLKYMTWVWVLWPPHPLTSGIGPTCTVCFLYILLTSLKVGHLIGSFTII